ncbi:ribonuclease H-like domain-containing protein [Tanacetum coccineum]
MTIQRSKEFQKETIYQQCSLSVCHPNGTLAKINDVGNLSLLSVHTLIKDSKLFVGFDEHKYYIQDLNLVITVGTGNEAGGFYLFDVKCCGKSSVGLSNSAFVCHASKQLWQRDLAKQTSDPFSLSDHKFESVGDLVHQDLCGPYKVINKDGYKYFLTAADDYSRAVRAYLIETKDEVAFYIESFIELICNINNGDEPPTMRRSTKSTEPKTYLEVAQDKNWVEAMNSEMKSLFRNNTWVLTDLLIDRNTIDCKWLFKIKYKSSGKIERYKAMIVAKGWPLYQLDVNNVFLYDDLNEDVYMDLPLGCYDESETKVCKLVNSLYGLKQAPRQWNEKLTTALKENGFKQSINDYSLFVNYDNGVFLALLVYVDHIVLTELWCEYGLLACKRAATPMQQNVNLNHIEFDKDKKLKSLTKYYKLVGKLIYMSLTRPDISYVVHSLSQHMHSHFTAALRVSSTCEVVWLVNLLKDLDVEGLLPVSLYCDSSFANQIAANPIFHEKIKHSGIDVHLVRENFASGVIRTVKGLKLYTLDS